MNKTYKIVNRSRTMKLTNTTISSDTVYTSQSDTISTMHCDAFTKVRHLSVAGGGVAEYGSIKFF